jgi:hypothetical protein
MAYINPRIRTALYLGRCGKSYTLLAGASVKIASALGEQHDRDRGLSEVAAWSILERRAKEVGSRKGWERWREPLAYQSAGQSSDAPLVFVDSSDPRVAPLGHLYLGQRAGLTPRKRS